MESVYIQKFESLIDSFQSLLPTKQATCTYFNSSFIDQFAGEEPGYEATSLLVSTNAASFSLLGLCLGKLLFMIVPCEVSDSWWG